MAAACAAILLLPSGAWAGQMVASWYESGHTTANGEAFDPDGLTCAHKTLPFNTYLKVTYKGRSATCRVNDRGPFIKGRHLDLSRGMKDALRFDGVQTVQVLVR